MTILSQGGQPGAPLLHQVARHVAFVFASTLAIQAATFAILAISALLLTTDDFARLSLIVAATMLANAMFELGLNITSTKMYGDTRDEAFLRTAFLVRVSCVPLGFLLGLAAALGWNADIGLGIAFGAALNVWNGIRSTDQAREDYPSFVAASLSFAALRALAGLGALYLTRDPVLIAAATYVLPIAGAGLSRSARLAREAFSGVRRPVREMLGYSAHVYVHALAFIATPYMPQFVIASRLEPTAVGTYGLLLTFTGPVSLLVYSLRAVLLPKMLGGSSRLEDMMWSWRGGLVILALWTALMSGGVLLGYGLDMVYAPKFPDILPAFLVFFAGFAATSMIGLYSLSIHTQGAPEIAVVVGLVKFAALIALLSLAELTLMDIVIITAGVMTAGEIALAALLGARRLSVAS